MPQFIKCELIVFASAQLRIVELSRTKMRLVTLAIILSVAALSGTLQVTEEELHEWEAFKVTEPKPDKYVMILNICIHCQKKVLTKSVM